MAKYLISFPSAAMVVPDGEWEAVGRDAHVMMDEAKAAGVYVFGGGIDENGPPVRVAADGRVVEGGYPWAPPFNVQRRLFTDVPDRLTQALSGLDLMVCSVGHDTKVNITIGTSLSARM